MSQLTRVQHIVKRIQNLPGFSDVLFASFWLLFVLYLEPMFLALEWYVGAFILLTIDACVFNVRLYHSWDPLVLLSYHLFYRLCCTLYW